MRNHHVTAALLASLVGASSTTLAQTQAANPVWRDASPHLVRHISVAPDVQLEVLDWGGSGPALVFLTGIASTAHIFDDFAPRFRNGFHVYGITRRGLGASSDPAGGYDSPTRARDIIAVLDSLHLDRVVLAGHSIAGDELSKVGATYAARVRALIYLDASDYGPARVAALQAIPPDPPSVLMSMTSADSASPAAVAAFRERSMGGGFRFPEAQVRAAKVFGPDGRLRGDGPGSNAIPKIWAGTEPSDFRRITAPALGLFATYPGGAAEHFRLGGYARADSATRAQADRIISQYSAWLKEGRDRFRAEMAHGTVVELPGAGHFVFFTRADRVEREMRDFLSRLP